MDLMVISLVSFRVVKVESPLEVKVFLAGRDIVVVIVFRHLMLNVVLKVRIL